MDVTRILITAAAIVVIVAGIAAAKTILVPFFFAAFVAVIAAGAYLRLVKWGLPSWLSIVVLVLLGIGFFTSMFFLVFDTIAQFDQVRDTYVTAYEQIRESVRLQLDEFGIEVPEVPEGVATEGFDLDSAMAMFGSLLQSFGSILGYAVLVLAMVVFIFVEVAVFPAKVRSAFGDPGNVLKFINEVNRAIERYFFIKTISNALTGGIVAFWMSLWGVEFALFWGMMTFLLNYIPYFGSVLAAVPAIAIALLGGGWVPAIAMALMFLATSTFFGNFFEPRLLGQSVNLSILFIFISMLFWSWILGPIGMIFAVPLTAALKIVLEMNDRTRWMGVLLAAGPRQES